MIKILNIRKETRAEKSGIRPGDIILSINGEEIRDNLDFEFYQNVWNTVIKTVEDAGGSFGHHHGVGISRSHWMPVEWGKSFDTLKDIKKLLDPNNILNPGKIYENPWDEGGEN